MGKIISRNGYMYMVEGEKGFETFHNLGKDPNDPIWKEEIEEIKHEDEEIEVIEIKDDNIEIKPKKKTQKKSED